MKKIISLIENHEWNRARTLWILCILEIKPENWIFSLFGFQDEYFINFISYFQELVFYYPTCQSSNSLKDLFFKKNENDIAYIYTKLEETCSICNRIIKCKFKYDPFCVFVGLLDIIDFTTLPSTIEIDT